MSPRACRFLHIFWVAVTVPALVTVPILMPIRLPWKLPFSKAYISNMSCSNLRQMPDLVDHHMNICICIYIYIHVCMRTLVCIYQCRVRTKVVAVYVNLQLFLSAQKGMYAPRKGRTTRSFILLSHVIGLYAYRHATCLEQMSTFSLGIR